LNPMAGIIHFQIIVLIYPYHRGEHIHNSDNRAVNAWASRLGGLRFFFGQHE